MITKENEKFTRQPAIRLFAAELAESKQTIIEHIEGRDFDSRHQLTPTGVKVNRVLMMGALVEVDNVGTSGEYLRGRIIDPTGAFNVYAGQYQPEALLSLSNLTVPCFVAVVGKTNAYRPDEETTIVSIRLETIVEIDADTRDYWVIETAARTMERVEKSQLQEAEKKKFKQMCKDALTKLVNMPQETGLPIHETPEVPAPQKIPDSPTIEQPVATKDKQPDELKERIFYLNEGRCYEPTVGFLHPILNCEKISPALPASTSEKQAEYESMTPMDALSIREHKDEEPDDKILQIKESKKSRTKPNDSIKAPIRKKKIKQEPVNSSQKTLFTEE